MYDIFEWLLYAGVWAADMAALKNSSASWYVLPLVWILPLALCALAMDGHPQHVSRLACNWSVRRPLSKDALRRALDQVPCRPAVVLAAMQTVFLLNLVNEKY